MANALGKCQFVANRALLPQVTETQANLFKYKKNVGSHNWNVLGQILAWAYLDQGV